MDQREVALQFDEMPAHRLSGGVGQSQRLNRAQDPHVPDLLPGAKRQDDVTRGGVERVPSVPVKHAYSVQHLEQDGLMSCPSDGQVEVQAQFRVFSIPCASSLLGCGPDFL